MRRVVALLGVAVVALAGCGKPEKVPVHPVSGRIFYDGKPAAGVHVFLYPTAAPGVPEIPANPHGMTGPDGRFTIGTYAEGDGAAEGSYQVVLIWPAETDTDVEEPEDRLLGWYTVARSTLTATVPAGGTELELFKLPARKAPPAESGGGIPGRN